LMRDATIAKHFRGLWIATNMTAAAAAAAGATATEHPPAHSGIVDV
jgi:hypothetical protein